MKSVKLVLVFLSGFSLSFVPYKFSNDFNSRLPNIRGEINSLIGIIKETEAAKISVNGNIRNLTIQEHADIQLGRKRIEQLDLIKSKEFLMDEIGKKELIQKLIDFKSLHFSSLKDFNYSNDICSDKISKEVWSLKDKSSRALKKMIMLSWTEEFKKNSYRQWYIRIEKNGSNEVLEIFSPSKINRQTLKIKVNENEYESHHFDNMLSIQNRKYSFKFEESMRLDFFNSITNCLE